MVPWWTLKIEWSASIRRRSWAPEYRVCIPINTVKTIVAELRTNGRVIRPWLGIKGKFVTDELRTLIALPLVDGLLVVDVEEEVLRNGWTPRR